MTRPYSDLRAKMPPAARDQAAQQAAAIETAHDQEVARLLDTLLQLTTFDAIAEALLVYCERQAAGTEGVGASIWRQRAEGLKDALHPW